MPKAATAAKPNIPAARAAPAKAKPAKVIRYPDLEVNGVVIPKEKAVMNWDMAVTVFGYEDEKEAIAEAVKKDPTLGLKTDKLTFGDSFLWTNANGHKCRAHRNAHNRPFDSLVAGGYKQSVLTKKWILNGETIIVDEEGNVVSGQHRLAGYIDAVLEWRKDSFWKRYWPEEPTMPVLVVCGVPSGQEARATLDNVRPRALSDTIYTSEVFADLGVNERKECSRMMDAAVDLLWKRTGANLDPHNKFQTHQASHDLMERHPKLKEAVRHLFTENKGRAISTLKLSPGQCAALMYLMGASGTKRADYEKGRSEKQLDLGRWQQAHEFWAGLAGVSGMKDGDKNKPKHKLWPVVAVMAKILDGKLGTEQLPDKRVACVVKAWCEFAEGGAITEANVTPLVKEDKDGRLMMCPEKDGNWPVVGGIDLGQWPEKDEADEPKLTPEEVAAQKVEEKDRRARELAAKAGGGGGGTPAEGIKEVLGRLAKEHPGKVLIHRLANGAGFSVWGKDAEQAAACLNQKAKLRPDGLTQWKLGIHGDVQGLVDALFLQGRSCMTVEEENGFDCWDMKAASKPPAKRTNEPAKPAAPAAKPQATTPAQPRGPAPVIAPKAGGPKLKKPAVPLRGGTNG